MEIRNLIIIIISVLMVILGFYVLFRNLKNKLNISFFVLSISASFWLGSSGIGESLLWVKISYLSAILSCIGFFYFAQYFPFQKYKVTKYIHLLFFLSTVAFTYFLFATNLFIKDASDSKELIVNVGIIYIIFNFYFLLIWIIGFYIIVQKYKTADGIHKWQLKNFLIAISIAFLGGLITNIIFPWILNIWDYYWLGPIFIVSLLWYAGYLLFRMKFK